MRIPSLSINQIYHVYNRGVNKRNLFENASDFKRFRDGFVSLNSSKNKEEKLVTILAYCLMPNHFHLLLEQCVEKGVSKFLHKLCTSHARYFNTKYDRTGALFNPKFKAKHVDTQGYYYQISKYIHRNPIDLYLGNDEAEGQKFVRSYKWSSFRTYLEKRDEDFVDKRIMEDFGDISEYVAYVFSDPLLLSPT